MKFIYSPNVVIHRPGNFTWFVSSLCDIFLGILFSFHFFLNLTPLVIHTTELIKMTLWLKLNVWSIESKFFLPKLYYKCTNNRRFRAVSKFFSFLLDIRDIRSYDQINSKIIAKLKVLAWYIPTVKLTYLLFAIFKTGLYFIFKVCFLWLCFLWIIY